MNRKWFLLSIVICIAFGLVGGILFATRTQAALAAATEPAAVASRSAGPPTSNILLVDDDDNDPDVQLYYVQLLNSLGYTYTVWDTDVSDVEPSATYLQNFDAVIWFTGDAFGGTAGPSSLSETELQIWLDSNAACLFVSSQDYVYDRGLTPFMTNYLGVEDAVSDVAQAVVTGTHLYAGLGPFTLTFPLSMSNYSDAFTLTAQAEQSFMGDKSTYSSGGELVDTNGRLIPARVLTSTSESSYAAASSLESETFGWQTTWLGYPMEALPGFFNQYRTLNRFLSNCFATDLQTVNTVSSPVVQVNEMFTYTIYIINHGPYEAKDITFQDFIPNTFEVYDFSPVQGCDLGQGDNLTCNFSELGAGQVQTVTVAVTPTFAGGFTNFVFSTNFSQDLTPENNSTSAFVRVLDPADTDVYLDKVVPAVVNRDVGGTIQVFGANFEPGTELFLDATSVSFIPDPNHPDAILNVSLPADFEKGVYSVIAQNPSGDPVLLFKSLVVYDPDALSIDEVLPQMGANDRPVTLNIFGDGFAPGMTGLLINSENQSLSYPLELPIFISENLVRAAAPYNLPAGIYDVHLTNPAGISATLPASYESLDWLAADDVGAFDFDFYTIPAAPREGDEVTVGLTVRRRTGEEAPFVTGQVGVNVNLGISGDGLTPDILLGTTGVISPNSTISLTLPWTPALAGSYHLSIDLASPDLMTDTIPLNNHLERQVTVLPASTDPDPPVISELIVNDGAFLTNNPSVVLNTTASDVGSGLAYIYYIDYRFDRDLGDWFPVQQTGWLPYESAHANFEWALEPTAGAHYIQAWVSDADGNISLPQTALINYSAPKNQINHDGGQVYRLPLFPLTSLQIDLTSLTGDADMYAWAPDGSLAASAFSGNPFEQLFLVSGINPPGLYQIDLFGFEATSYWFEVTVGGAGETPVSIDEVLGHVKGGDQPLQVIENYPGGDVNVPPPPGAERVYLPVIVR